MLSEIRQTEPAEERLFSDAEVDRMSDKRNKTIQKKLDDLSAKHTALLEQQKADAELISERDGLQQRIEAMELEADPEREALESKIAEVSAHAEHFKTLYEADHRRITLQKAAVDHNAINVDQLEALTADVPTDQLPAAVAGMVKTAPNLFAPQIATGVGGNNSPPRLGFPAAVSAMRLQSMSQAEYLQLRKQGVFDSKLGKRRN